MFIQRSTALKTGIFQRNPGKSPQFQSNSGKSPNHHKRGGPRLSRITKSNVTLEKVSKIQPCGSADSSVSLEKVSRCSPDKDEEKIKRRGNYPLHPEKCLDIWSDFFLELRWNIPELGGNFYQPRRGFFPELCWNAGRPEAKKNRTSVNGCGKGRFITPFHPFFQGYAGIFQGMFGFFPELDWKTR
ncbi:MAG: hypothetical protein KJ077_26055 [Anaerolineae bacterium]|nr:hypothetical protein [Anaerolineae bacterium]